MTTQEAIECYLAKGGVITQCKKGQRSLPDPDSLEILNIGLRILWQQLECKGKVYTKIYKTKRKRRRKV